MAYIVELTEKEKDTADWLSDHGYLGCFFDVARLEESPEDGGQVYKYTLTEPDAWAFSESVHEDEHAFLTCNGSPSLAGKMFGLLDEIV
jgi:hypothetical protein